MNRSARCALALLLALGGLAGCVDVGSMFGPSKSGKAEVSELAMEDYLTQAEVNRPEILRAATLAIREGRVYRERVQDQKSRWTLLQIWIEKEPQNTLRLETTRDETCPKCKGSGKRQWDNQFMQNTPFDTRCLGCDGKGSLPHHTVSRKFVLGGSDFTTPEAAGAPVQAPAEAQRWIDKLASQDPKTRLAACRWLDENYVKKGVSFQTLMPMLKKARRYESEPKKKKMVWQFWAGRGLPDEADAAFYRIYAEQKSGKVTESGFYAE